MRPAALAAALMAALFLAVAAAGAPHVLRGSVAGRLAGAHPDPAAVRPHRCGHGLRRCPWRHRPLRRLGGGRPAGRHLDLQRQGLDPANDFGRAPRARPPGSDLRRRPRPDPAFWRSRRPVAAGRHLDLGRGRLESAPSCPPAAGPLWRAARLLPLHRRGDPLRRGRLERGAARHLGMDGQRLAAGGGRRGAGGRGGRQHGL